MYGEKQDCWKVVGWNEKSASPFDQRYIRSRKGNTVISSAIRVKQTLNIW